MAKQPPTNVIKQKLSLQKQAERDKAEAAKKLEREKWARECYGE